MRPAVVRGSQPQCSNEECDRPTVARGMCHKHWRQWRSHGGIPQPKLSVLERFWVQIKVGNADACWLWTGQTNNKGYGRFSLYDGPEGRIRVFAHRFAYELATRESVEGSPLLHSCDTPPCCNPAHLRPGTQLENIRDALSKGRMDLSGLLIGQKRGPRKAKSARGT